jgi:hypothetical protein
MLLVSVIALLKIGTGIESIHWFSNSFLLQTGLRSVMMSEQYVLCPA